MGIFSSSEFKEAHMLHYLKFCDNKLYVYFPSGDKFYTFSIFQNDKKFKFYAQGSISTKSGSIYLIGGKVMTNPLDDDIPITTLDNNSTLSITNFVAKINLKKHRDFRIHLNDMKSCPPLPDPTFKHLMVNVGPYIYVIGGEVPETGPTRNCLKFHTKKKTWEKISELSLGSKIQEPCGIAIHDSIYVFDTAVKGNLPRVHRYFIMVDQWMEILIHPKTRGLTIPPSLSSSVYQISEKEVMVLGGVRVDREDKDKRGFWFIFDFLTEEIKDLAYQDGLGQWKKESQGNTNYEGNDMVYGRLSERSVKVYDKFAKKWHETRLTPENTDSSAFGCCARKK